MAGEVRIGAVDHRFVEARPGDARLEIVADRLPRHAAEIRERTTCEEIQFGRLCVRVASA